VPVQNPAHRNRKSRTNQYNGLSVYQRVNNADPTRDCDHESGVNQTLNAAWRDTPEIKDPIITLPPTTSRPACHRYRARAASFALFAVTVSAGPGVLAELCPAQPELVYEQPGGLTFNPLLPVRASAESVVSKDGIVTLTGNTRIEYQNRVLNAENASYNRESGEVSIDGEVNYQSGGINLSTRDANFNLLDTTFTTGESDYHFNLGDKRATGNASSIERTGEGLFRLKNATYSTCPPGDRSWYIEAEDIRLNNESGVGTADKITLNFKGVPILAVPTFSFPISQERKTGFLAPSLARSESTGLELRVPWYWNIRPYLDATLTPRIMSRRGTQLQSQWRYLNKQGAWQLDSEYLYDDNLAPADRRRSFTRLRHNGTFGSRWTTELDASEVSDKDYFEDLGDSLQVISISHLEQRADLRFSTGVYSFLARAQSFQTVDQSIAPGDRPYRKLPQLRFNADWPRWRYGLEPKFDAELVYFDRSASVTGSRLDIHPKLSWPINRTAWFIKPSVSTRFTQYRLSNAGSGNPSSIDRAFSSASVEAGLFLDRPVNERGKIQTLEPRLFFLRVPYENQDPIPVFDSVPLDFNFSQLFRENRFSGSDRIADANQLSLALTSRLIDVPTGREQLLASIGQIAYFDDRRVSLDGTVNRRDFSDFVAEVEADLDNDWLLRSSLQWDPDENRTVRSSALLTYRPDSERIINLGHRRVNTGSSAETEQIDFSILWPVQERWRIAGRWNYSIAESTSIESLLGIEYQDCCWSFRFAMRRYISDVGNDHETAYYLQLVLKGLAPLGEDIGELLEAGVLGYEDEN